jgi:predicted transcriptional regulator
MWVVKRDIWQKNGERRRHLTPQDTARRTTWGGGLPHHQRFAPRNAAPVQFRRTPIDAAYPFRYNDTMTMKEKAIQAVQALPEDASIEDAMERLFLLAKVERGIRQADAGDLIPHEKVKERMAKWLR